VFFGSNNFVAWTIISSYDAVLEPQNIQFSRMESLFPSFLPRTVYQDLGRWELSCQENVLNCHHHKKGLKPKMLKLTEGIERQCILLLVLDF